MPRARLRDVAELAGVSIRTVSNVVNGYAPVSAATRAKVEAAVEEVGYRPNVVARNLKRGRSGMIALALPELDVPYFAELVRAVTGVARESGYTVVVDQTDGEHERERELIGADSRMTIFDGLILSPISLRRSELAERGSSIPIVLLGERIAAGPFDHIAIDNEEAARQATAHLIELGRQRVAAIGDQPFETGDTAQQRTVGFRRAHADAGRPVDENLVIGCRHFHRCDGANAMRELLRAPGGPPDAVFCYNDLLALGAMRALLESGVRIPEDVAVIGFDDIEDGRFATPTLSTIAPNKDDIARLAVDALLRRLDTPASPPEPHELRAEFQLVPRESTLGREPPPQLPMSETSPGHPMTRNALG